MRVFSAQFLRSANARAHKNVLRNTNRDAPDFQRLLQEEIGRLKAERKLKQKSGGRSLVGKNQQKSKVGFKAFQKLDPEREQEAVAKARAGGNVGTSYICVSAT
jgi:hypothetical protein